MKPWLENKQEPRLQKGVAPACAEKECISSGYLHGQIHPLVDRAKQFKCPARVEWSDRVIIVAVEGYINCWRTRFCCEVHRATFPGAVFNNMFHSNIIDQINRLPLANGDGVLQEVRTSHMHRWPCWYGAYIVNAAGSNRRCQNT
jgi:hypothetical protein